MFLEKNINFANYINYLKENNGLIFFHIGIFLLFSAPAISVILILIALLNRKTVKQINPYEKYWYYPLLHLYTYL